MCLEYFRRFVTRHKTVWCPSKTIEDGVFLCFFLVDLSRRRAILLRGGPRRKGSGGIITNTFSSLSPAFPCSLEHPPFFLYAIVLAADVGLAVVLLPGEVVPQAPAVVPYYGAVVPYYGAVVPQEPTVVPLLWSCSTVAPRPSATAPR